MSKAYEILLGIKHSELIQVANQLNDTGFATDEDGLCLGSSLIEHWSQECTDHLRKHGYRGGHLQNTAKYFGHCGAIYVLFDSDQHEFEDATQELERVARHHTTA